MGAAEALGGAVEHKLGGAFGIAHDVGIPEPNHLPAGTFQIGGALGIVILLIEMLAAVEFDREFRFATREVDDVSPDDQLPCERRPISR